MVCKSVYILIVQLIQCIFRYNRNVKISSSDKVKGIKLHHFFFRKLKLIPVLHLIWDSYMSWSAKFAALKLCVGIFIFNLVSFLWKFIFLLSKMNGLFDFNTSSVLSKLCNWKTAHGFAAIAARSFNIDWYLRDLVLHKNWTGDKFVKFAKSTFWEQFFSSILL